MASSALLWADGLYQKFNLPSFNDHSHSPLGSSQYQMSDSAPKFMQSKDKSTAVLQEGTLQQGLPKAEKLPF